MDMDIEYLPFWPTATPRATLHKGGMSAHAWRRNHHEAHSTIPKIASLRNSTYKYYTF